MSVKRISFICLLLILSFNQLTSAAPVKLNLTAAIAMAETNNDELAAARLLLSQSELELKKAKAANSLNQHLAIEITAKINYLTAQKNFSNSRADIIKDIIAQYLDILIVKKEIHAQQLTVKAEKRLYEEYQQRFKLAEINRIDLLDQQNIYRDAEINLQILKDDYQQKLLNFKNSLNISPAKKLQLAEIEQLKKWEITENEALKTAFANNFQLQIANLEIKQAELSKKLQKIDQAAIEQQLAQIKLKQKQLNLKQLQDQLKSDVKAAYLNLKQKENLITLEKERLDKIEQEFKFVQREYELGSSSKTEALQYEAAYYQQLFTWQNSLLNYCLQAEELADLIKIEPVVIDYAD